MTSNSVDDIKAFTPFFDKLRNDLWWILQICIHHHNSITTTRIEPSSNRELMSKVPTQRNHFYVTVDITQFLRNNARIIHTTIIDKNKFKRRRANVV